MGHFVQRYVDQDLEEKEKHQEKEYNQLELINKIVYQKFRCDKLLKYQTINNKSPTYQ